MKDKNCMIILMNAEKTSNKIQQSFMIKILKMVIKGTYCSVIKATRDKPTTNIILNEQTPQVFSLRSGTRHGCLLHHSYSK